MAFVSIVAAGPSESAYIEQGFPQGLFCDPYALTCPLPIRKASTTVSSRYRSGLASFISGALLHSGAKEAPRTLPSRLGHTIGSDCWMTPESAGPECAVGTPRRLRTELCREAVGHAGDQEVEKPGVIRGGEVSSDEACCS